MTCITVWRCQRGNQKPWFDWRRTDNAMAKRKMTKRQKVIYKTLHRNLKIEHHEPH